MSVRTAGREEDSFVLRRQTAESIEGAGKGHAVRTCPLGMDHYPRWHPCISAQYQKLSLGGREQTATYIIF